MQQSTILSSIDTNDKQDSLEDHPLFTPDLEYFTPATNVSLDNRHAYQPRTLTPYNMERQTILPVFPPSSLFCTNANDHQQLFLLLANVPSKINEYSM